MVSEPTAAGVSGLALCPEVSGFGLCPDVSGFGLCPDVSGFALCPCAGGVTANRAAARQRAAVVVVRAETVNLDERGAAGRGRAL